MKFYFENRHSILILNDNKSSLGYLANNLPSKYKYFITSNMKEASEIIKRERPVLIIAEIPKLKSGSMELCKKIKSSFDTCHIPFMVLSENFEIDLMIKSYEMGADDFNAKPFDKYLLSAKINRLVKNRLMIKEKYRAQNFVAELEKIRVSEDEHFLRIVKKILTENISDPDLNVTSLSKKMNISTTQLYRKLKETTGRTPVEFIRRVRLEKAYKMLSEDKISITQICYNTGFNNVSYFIKCFKEMFGITPAHYRNRVKYDFA